MSIEKISSKWMIFSTLRTVRVILVSQFAGCAFISFVHGQRSGLKKYMILNSFTTTKEENGRNNSNRIRTPLQPIKHSPFPTEKSAILAQETDALLSPVAWSLLFSASAIRFTLTLVFNYTQFPGKMAMERQGGRVREKVLFNKGCCTSAAHKVGGVKRRRGTAAGEE